MSIQEIKSRIHQLVDSIDNQPALEQLLNDANLFASDENQPQATLQSLTSSERERLDRAIQQHKEGQTVSNEEMKQRHHQWLNK